jgi:hypothetical protein
MKYKNYTISSTDTGKVFEKIQHPFMTKTLSTLGIKSTHLNINICGNPRASITLNGEKVIVFHLRCETRWDSLSHLLFNIIVDVLAKAIWQEKEIKDIPIRKEEVKLPILK